MVCQFCLVFQKTTIIVGDFNTPLTTMDRSTKQKINEETQTLKDTMDQLDLIDIYRPFHPKTINFTFFSSAHGTFSRIDHILGHKSSLGKFKKIEIILLGSDVASNLWHSLASICIFLVSASIITWASSPCVRCLYVSPLLRAPVILGEKPAIMCTK